MNIQLSRTRLVSINVKGTQQSSSAKYIESATLDNKKSLLFSTKNRVENWGQLEPHKQKKRY